MGTIIRTADWFGIKNILLSEDVAETVALVLKMPIRAMVSEIDIRPTNPR